MNFTLPELIPLERLEDVRRQFEAVTGVRIVFTDAGGRPVTPLTDPLAFCGSLVRADGTVCLRRAKWDVPEADLEDRIRKQHSQAEPIAHRCRGGFKDTAAPIVVEGRVVGLIVFGRTLTHEPDIERFRKLAVEGGMPPEIGQAVAQKATIMPDDRVACIAGLIVTLANLLAAAANDTLRAQRVLELEALRDSLIHMIVHDLRTPLTSIIGSLQTVEQSEYELDTTRYVVPIALTSAQELLEMVNTLLDINKMESGSMTLNLTEVNFVEVAHQAIAQVRGLLDEYEHHFEEELHVQRSVLADADLLRRVVVNLLGNAIKFSPSGSHIKLVASTDESGLTFSVHDNGPGIPVEDQERIFEKFGQAATREQGRKHSTGLGLTFCKMVAEAHGGRIWLQSQVGKGSVFYVFIPTTPPASSATDGG